MTSVFVWLNVLNYLCDYIYLFVFYVRLFQIFFLLCVFFRNIFFVCDCVVLFSVFVYVHESLIVFKGPILCIAVCVYVCVSVFLGVCGCVCVCIF